MDQITCQILGGIAIKVNMEGGANHVVLNMILAIDDCINQSSYKKIYVTFCKLRISFEIRECT